MYTCMVRSVVVVLIVDPWYTDCETGKQRRGRTGGTKLQEESV